MDSKHTFCSHCGVCYANSEEWPRACKACGGMEWDNPIPVAVVIQPVDDGFLLCRRNIHPGFGELALPGGFVDRRETFRMAAARELQEEMDLRVSEFDLTFFDEYMAREINLLLTFWMARPLRMEDLPPFVPNEEVSGREIAYTPMELAFESHTLMLGKAFRR